MPASVWKGRLAFGMVAIPVRLFKAARRERIRFHRVYRPAAPPEPPEPDEEEIEPPPSRPPSRSSIHEMPRTAPPLPSPAPPTPASEPVARVRHLAVGEVTQQPVEAPQILK